MPEKVPERRGDVFWQKLQLLKGTYTSTPATQKIVSGLGWTKQVLLMLSVTNADTDAADTLDIYIDVSPDGGVTWINAVHFPQFLGTSVAAKHWFFLAPTSAATATIDVTTDAAVSVGRQIGLTDQMRVRLVIVDANANASFTLEVDGYFRN